MQLKVKCLHESATIPTRGTEGAAAYDLYAVERTKLDPMNDPKRVRTGIAIELPPGTVGLIRPRSSLATKGVLVYEGTIDEDYRGELSVIMATEVRTIIQPGQRIAQLLIVPVVHPVVVEVDELSDTERGEGGFGSTGV